MREMPSGTDEEEGASTSSETETHKKRGLRKVRDLYEITIQKALEWKGSVLAFDPGRHAAWAHFSCAEVRGWGTFNGRDFETICAEMHALQDYLRDSHTLIVVEKPPILSHMSTKSVQTFGFEVGALCHALYQACDGQREIMGGHAKLSFIAPTSWAGELCLFGSSKLNRVAILRNCGIDVKPRRQSADEADAILMALAVAHMHLQSKGPKKTYKLLPFDL